jgi:two-component system response regulator AtoC
MSQDILKRPSIRLYQYGKMLTAAPEMLELFETLERVARTEVTILIRGASGTGKELVARALHAAGRRRKGPFQAVNCAVLTPELLASELFGHARGAFTGAIREHKGLFERADGGTIFLDEVAELPLDLQARLLRVLEERSFTPLGSARHVKVDVRLTSATLRSLREEVQHRRFREDLMYRIRVVPLFLPSLVERTGDVEALLWHFVETLGKDYGRIITGIEAQAREALLDYHWPGNVRELYNVVEHAYVLGQGSVLRFADLTPELRHEPPPGVDSLHQTQQRDQRQQLLEALREAGWRKGAAADRLGISRSTLWRRMLRFNVTQEHAI